MECVQSVSNSVLTVYHMEKLSLHEVCARVILCLHIYFFCVEVLSQMLDLAQIANQMQGMRLARRCPRVSHLFFC